MKFTILIPYYNELDSILKYEIMLFPVVDDIMREFGYDYEYVFYDDGSKDGGYRIIAHYQIFFNSYPIKSFRDETNMGLGHAIREGLKLCESDYVIIMDSDLSYRPSSIRDLLMYMDKYTDCVSSSPYQFPHLIKATDSRLRMMGSVVFNKIYSLLIGHHITCATSMFRLYKLSTLDEFTFTSDGFDINAEILSELILNGKNVIEVPVTLYDREYGTSKMHVIKEVKRSTILIGKILIKRCQLLFISKKR